MGNMTSEHIRARGQLALLCAQDLSLSLFMHEVKIYACLSDEHRSAHVDEPAGKSSDMFQLPEYTTSTKLCTREANAYSMHTAPLQPVVVLRLDGPARGLHCNRGMVWPLCLPLWENSAARP